MKEYPVLYRKIKNKVRMWKIYVIDSTIHTEYGEVGGKIQHTEDLIQAGKNIGKKNETTKEQQAESEALSKWTHQIERGNYVQNIGEESSLISPMLAHSFDDYGHKVKFPCLVQPKLDGIRMLYQQSSLFSRKKKEIVSLPYIKEALKVIFDKYGYSFSLDGEAYNHDLKNEFEQITGAVRKDDPLTYEEAKVQYHLYDIVHHDEQDFRNRQLVDLAHQIQVEGFSEILKVVPTIICRSLEDIEYWYNEFVEQGYEGLIIRNMDGLYEQDHRSFNLLKYKKFDEEDFDIIRVEEGRGKLKGHAIFVCQAKNKKEFKAKLKGETAYLKELFENPKLWQGKKASVKFQGFSKYGVPRFPVAKSCRNYE